MLALFREAFPETFEGTRARVQVFRTGQWVHPEAPNEGWLETIVP